MTYEEAQRSVAQSVASHGNRYTPKRITPYQFWARVVRLVDADTLDLTVSLGFHLSLEDRFRLVGVDCPETYGVKRTSEEYARGLEALDFVQAHLREGDWVEAEVYADRREKYGRWLCQLFVQGRSLNALLLSEGHATPT